MIVRKRKLPGQFEEYDIVGVDLEMVIEVILDSSLHLIVSGCDFEVALRSKESTWYFLMEASLSLERSNSSSTRLFAMIRN